MQNSTSINRLFFSNFGQIGSCNKLRDAVAVHRTIRLFLDGTRPTSTRRFEHPPQLSELHVEGACGISGIERGVWPERVRSRSVLLMPVPYEVWYFSWSCAESAMTLRKSQVLLFWYQGCNWNIYYVMIHVRAK